MTHHNSRSHRSRILWIPAAILAAGISLTGCTGSTTPASTAPVADASSPSPTETGLSHEEIEAKIKQLEIPAGQSTDALGAAIIDRLNQWANDGSDASLEQRIDDEVPQGKSLEDITADIAGKNREVYAVALFGEDYRSHPSVVTYVNQSEGVNRDTVRAYGQTEWNDKATNSEGYRSWREFYPVSENLEVTSNDGDSRKYVFYYTNHDNADKNIVDEGTLPRAGKLFVTVETVGGVDIVTDITDQVTSDIGS